MGRFILTGSHKFPLMREVADSLAGRTALVALENLSSGEIGLTPQRDWTGVLSRGLFPELWRLPELAAVEFYSSYVATYLERDVRQVLN